MNRLIQNILRMPILWKITLWSSFLMMLLFSAYNTVQYVVINNWMYKQEEKSIRQSSLEIKTYFENSKKYPLPNPTKTMRDITFLSSLNEKNQFIRVLDEKGNVLYVVENQLPQTWVPPQVSEVPSIVNVWYGNDHLLINRTPFTADHRKGTIEIVRNLENVDEVNQVILGYFLLTGLGAILLSGIGGYIISRQIVKPIKIMINTMQKIQKEGNKGLGLRVSYIHNGDEISELVEIFNGMMDRLEHSFLQQKQFVEDASHELRTPISIIEGHLSLLDRWGKRDPAILDESLTLALEETKRLKRIVLELLDLSRVESKPLLRDVEPIHPAPIITKIIQNFSVLYPDFTFRTELHFNDHHLIAISENHFEQILLILLDNAVKYSSSNKTVEIGGNVEGDQINFTVKDYGHGIPQSDLPNIFHRFYRADKARSRAISGVGLGLSIARRLVTNYHGKIQVESQEGTGTRFIISFPLHRRSL
jgi:two-component system sensor histidine kinase ArlS